MVTNDFLAEENRVNRWSKPIPSLLLAIFFFGTMAATGQNFFPAGAFDPNNVKLDSFKSRWYSEQLTALKEPSLFDARQNGTVQSYRFLWLRTFHHPVTIRILIHADGSGTVITKMSDGAGGYKPGKLIVDKTESLSPDRVKKLGEKIQRLGYWKLPLRDTNREGLDGSQWVIEAVDHGTYHLVDRWSPENGPVRELGLYFIHELSGFYLKDEKIY
jgi:hypothetical protein